MNGTGAPWESPKARPKPASEPPHAQGPRGYPRGPCLPARLRPVARLQRPVTPATVRSPIARPTVMPTPECITATVVASSTGMTENGAGPCAPYTPCQRSTTRSRAQRLRGQVQHGVVDRLVVERGRVLAVLVRIADDQLAIGRGADQQVDAVIQQHGRARLDHLAQRQRGRQVRERAVVHAGQTGQQRPVQREQGRLEGRAQHLQARDFQVQRREAFRQQRQVIMAGADEHMIATELAGSGRHPALLHRARQRAGDEVTPSDSARWRVMAGSASRE